MLDTTYQLNDTLSLSKLHAIKNSLIAYDHYIHYTAPMFSLIIATIIALFIIFFVHHFLVVGEYEVYHPFNMKNVIGWLESLAGGLLIGFVSFGIILAFCHVGQPNTSVTQISPTGEATDPHPMRYINTAIHYRKSSIPFVQKRLKSQSDAYSKTKRPTKLQKDVMSTYVQDEQQKISSYKHYVNSAKNMKITRGNYI